MQRRTTREQRIRIVARFRKSGLTQREFAEREDITVSALQNWLYRLGKKGAAPRFVEVVAPQSPVPMQAIEIRVGELAVVLPGDVAAERVAAIVSALADRTTAE